MADDNAPGPFLRLHLVDGDNIDLVTAGEIPDMAFVTEQLAEAKVITGTHPGGNACAVPVSSIVWAEAFE